MGLQALQYSMSLSFVYRCKADVLQFNVQSTIGSRHLVESTFCCVNVWLCRPIESTFGGLTYSRFDVLWVVVLEYRRSLGRHFTEAQFFSSHKLNHVYRLCTLYSMYVTPSNIYTNINQNLTVLLNAVYITLLLHKQKKIHLYLLKHYYFFKSNFFY